MRSSALLFVLMAINMSSVVKVRSLIPDIRLFYRLPEIIVGSSETAIQYSGKGRFRIA